MNLLIKELEKIASDISGNVLAIGVDEKIADILDNNKKIINLDVLSYNATKLKKIDKNKKQKQISYRKFRKKYTRNKPDIIIINYNTIENIKEKFMRDSAKMAMKTIYIYNSNEEYINKYKRYNTTTNNNIVTKINFNSKKRKTHKYYIKDKLDIIFNHISDFLTM